MRRITAFALLFVLPLALVGCFEANEDYTLNPDGSGKVVFEITRPLNMGMMTAGQEKSPQQMMRDAADKILTDSKGVDAWADVSFKLLDGGKMFFKGTAYFRDFNRVRVSSAGMMEDNVPKFIKTRDGIALRAIPKKKKLGPKKMTEEQIVAKMAKAREDFKKNRMMMGMMFDGLLVQQTFRMPGTISDSKVFTKKDANTVRLRVEGRKIIKAMGDLMQDDRWLRAQVVAGTEKSPGMADLNEKMFGVKGELEVAVSAPLKAQFDYAAEVAKARKAYPGLREQLKLPAAAVVAPMGADGGIKSVRVGGVRLIRETDEKNGVRPFNWTKSYSVSMIAEFSGAVMKIKGGTLTTAVTDNGEELLKESKWDRRISFPRLSKDRMVAVLEARLKAPSAKAKGLKELSGELTFLTSTGTKKVDLGLVNLTTGSTGKALGAQIKSIQDSKWQKGKQELELLLQVEADKIKSVTFHDQAGKQLQLSKGGTFGGRNQTTLRFNMKGKFPAQAKIVVEVHDELVENKAAFSIKNVDLVGNPR